MGVSVGALRRFGNGDWVERLGRLGLVTKGVSFGIVGVLAVLVALGAGGAPADREGALRLLSKQWYGVILLVALGLGFGAYAAWRFTQALLDRDDNGSEFEGSAKRLGSLAKGVFYLGLSVLSFSFVTGPRGESRDEPEQTARVFELPLGRWLVLALGGGLIVYGFWNGYRSFSGRFRKHLKKSKMDREDVTPVVNVVGFLGHLARMVLFSMVGLFSSAPRGSTIRARRSASTRRSRSWRSVKADRSGSGPPPRGCSPTASSAWRRPATATSRDRKTLAHEVAL
jgi:hypothetical protein